MFIEELNVYERKQMAKRLLKKGCNVSRVIDAKEFLSDKPLKWIDELKPENHEKAFVFNVYETTAYSNYAKIEMTGYFLTRTPNEAKAQYGKIRFDVTDYDIKLESNRFCFVDKEQEIAIKNEYILFMQEKFGEKYKAEYLKQTQNNNDLCK